MDNLDETQSIDLSLKLHPYLQSNASVRARWTDDLLVGKFCLHATYRMSYHPLLL